MLAKSSSETVKEVYARFGLAMYYAQTLEFGLVGLVTALHRARGDTLAVSDPDAFLEQRLADTMGKLCKRLKAVLGQELPDGWDTMLTEALEERNHVTHHFFRVNAEKFTFEAGCHEMIGELDSCAEKFRAADAATDAMVTRILKRAGITPSVLEGMVKENVEAEGRRLEEARKQNGPQRGPAALGEDVERMSLASVRLRAGSFPRLAYATWHHTLSTNLDDFVPPGIFWAIGLDPSVLTGTERCSLEDLEARVSANPTAMESDLQLRWRLLAMSSIQMVFDGRLLQRTAVGRHDVELALWRFYYLGLFALGEALLANLNGLRVSSSQLLRIFVALNILQNHYYRTCMDSDSYDAFDKFVLSGSHPPLLEAASTCLPDVGLGPAVRKRLVSLLASLDFSPTADPGQGGSTDVRQNDDYWREAGEAVDAVLRMYYINFPMLLHPIDIVRKFGFNGPVGLFVDPFVGYAVRKTLSAEDFATLKEQALGVCDPSAALLSLEGKPDLSEAQIIASMPNDGSPPVKTVDQGRLAHLAQLTAIRTIMALEPIEALKKRLIEGCPSQRNAP